MIEQTISHLGIDVKVTIEEEGLDGYALVSVFLDGDRIASERTDGDEYGPVYSAVVKSSGEDTGDAATATEPAASPVPDNNPPEPEPNLKEGWARPVGARKWHWYDEDGRSACGKYMILFGSREQGMDDSPDNCAGCRRKVLARKEAT